MIQRVGKLILALAWLAFIGMPIAFLFATPGASPTSGSLGHLYWAGIQLFGERTFRIGFCVLWLAAHAALFWRLVLSRRPVDPTPVDGLADFD